MEFSRRQTPGSPEILYNPQVLESSVRAPACSAVPWLTFLLAVCSRGLAWSASFLSKGIRLYIILRLLYKILFSHFASYSNFWCIWDVPRSNRSVVCPFSCLLWLSSLTKTILIGASETAQGQLFLIRDEIGCRVYNFTSSFWFVGKSHF